MEGITVFFIVAVYLLILVGIGCMSMRYSLRTGEDYFMASRSLGFIALLFATFATNQTAFGIVGVPALGYSTGIGVWGYTGAFMGMAAFYFYVIGARAWMLGKKHGFMTQAQMVENAVGSRAASYILWGLLTFYTIPYLMIGLIGGGVSLETMTGGFIPYWLSALLLTAIILFYTAAGGMRGTVWTNIFQGLVFTVFFLIALILISSQLGGLSHIFASIRENSPELLRRSGVAAFTPRRWFSFFVLISIVPVMFPHVFVRLLCAKSLAPLKATIVAYPAIYTIGWLPATLIGIIGAKAIPGLEGTEVDSIVPMMIQNYLSPWLVGVGLAGILAAMMSSLDAQILTLSNMLTKDILDKVTDLSPEEEVFWGRIFVVLLALLAYLGAIIRPATIMAIAEYSFTGYVGLFPVILACLYWPRVTGSGVIASMITSFVVIQFLFSPLAPAGVTMGYLPVIPGLILSTLVLIGVSLVTGTQKESRELSMTAGS